MQEISGKPDLIIILAGSPKERRRRRQQRHADDRDLQQPETLADGNRQFVAAAEELAVPYQVVETDGQDEEQVFQAVCKVIDAWRYGKEG